MGPVYSTDEPPNECGCLMLLVYVRSLRTKLASIKQTLDWVGRNLS